jgi:glycosyltransferase involved in cell wall biosynthesis
LRHRKAVTRHGIDYTGASVTLPITVVIPVRSEAQLIAECITRLKRFARIVVIDSGSTDGTPEIASRLGAEVVDFRWNGKFPKKRNWFLRNCRIETPWVLFLDADEFVDDRFCDELATVLPTTRHSGFWLNYHRWFLGHRLRHGESNRKLALFRVGMGEYERIDDVGCSALDMEIHEHPIMIGSVGEIQTPIDHRDFRNMEHWLAKHNHYSTWEAHRIAALRNSEDLAWAVFSRRQRMKYAALGRWWLPPTHFIYSYVLRLGFLDGYAGFAYALAKCFYFWQVGVKLAELSQPRPSASEARA